MGSMVSDLFGGESRFERGLTRTAESPFEAWRTQRFLPPELRQRFTGPALSSGMAGLAELLRMPGGLSPAVSEAILPRLAGESERIGQEFRGIGAQQQGAAARGNVPISIRGALSSALDVAQERAQRGARREALSESEALRRSDIGQMFPLLDALLQFTSAGKGTAVQGLGAAAQSDAQRQAARMAFWGSLVQGLAGTGASSERFKEDLIPINENAILDAVKSMPVYSWRYRGQDARHIGPMAEDFHGKFGLLGNNPDVIPFLDAFGTLLVATKTLAKKVERLEAR